MADEATFEFNTDDDIRKATEAVNRQVKGMEIQNAGLKKMRTLLNEKDLINKELEKKQVNVSRMNARGKASRLMSPPGDNGDPNIVLGSGNEALEPVRRRPNWMAQTPYGQTPGETPELGHDFLPQAMSAMKGKAGSAVEKKPGIGSAIMEAVGGLKGVATAAGAVSAGFAVLNNALSTAASVQKGAQDATGSIQQQVARAANVLGVDRNELMDKVVKSSDQQGTLRFLGAMVNRRQTTGAGIKASQLNNDLDAISNQAQYSAADVTALAMAGRSIPGSRSGKFAEGTPERNYTDIQSRRNNAEYNANSAVDQNSANHAQFYDIAKKQWENEHPYIAWLSWARSGRTAKEARDMEEAYSNQTDGGVTGNNSPSLQTPIVQPTYNLTGSGKGRDVAAAAAAATAAAMRQMRKPNPRSGSGE
jgi:hypothetical protein